MIDAYLFLFEPVLKQVLLILSYTSTVRTRNIRGIFNLWSNNINFLIWTIWFPTQEASNFTLSYSSTPEFFFSLFIAKWFQEKIRLLNNEEAWSRSLLGPIAVVSSLIVTWRRGVVVITTSQLHSTKLEVKLCTGPNPPRGVSEIRNGEGLWQWSRLEIRLNLFCRSFIPQKQFIITFAKTKFEIHSLSISCYQDAN